jgi:tripartite-type tricarboxylate transporter receptor subunit TctC
LLTQAAHAATPAEFYKGRTVPVIIGYSAGGGYDLYARVLAEHMGRHIPGNPTLIPQNMPGAGSIRAALYLFTAAPRDGSVIGTFARGMVSTALIGDAKFDARQFAWLGSVTKDTTLCISWNASPIKTWHDAMTRQFTVGGEGAAGDPDIFAKLYKNVFGAKIRLATGFPGTTDVTLAMRRGEVDGLCGISWSTVKSRYPDWVAQKKINFLLQAGARKDPELPNVPMALDFAHTPEQKQVLDFVVSSEVLARPFVAPPGIPANRKAVLRKAFDDTMKDPAFLADAKKTMLDINPVSGPEVDAIVASLYATPKDVVNKAMRAIN